MNHIRLWLVIAISIVATALAPMISLAASAPLANGPSFDCRHASSTAEKAICTDPALSLLDRRIAERYAILIKQLDKPSADKLREDQRWFISSRDGAYLGRKFDDLSSAMHTRLAFLNAIRSGGFQGLAGKWRNLSGEIVIAPKAPGTFAFEANTAEPTQGAWVCQATGTITASGAGQWKAHVTDPTDATFEIKRQGVSLIITEPGEVHYCGMNGGLAGGFFPIGR